MTKKVIIIVKSEEKSKNHDKNGLKYQFYKQKNSPRNVGYFYLIYLSPPIPEFGLPDEFC